MFRSQPNGEDADADETGAEVEADAGAGADVAGDGALALALAVDAAVVLAAEGAGDRVEVARAETVAEEGFLRAERPPEGAESRGVDSRDMEEASAGSESVPKTKKKTVKKMVMMLNKENKGSSDRVPTKKDVKKHKCILKQKSTDTRAHTETHRTQRHPKENEPTRSGSGERVSGPSRWR